MGEAGQLLALDRKKMSMPLICASGVRTTAAGEAEGRKDGKWGWGELNLERRREGDDKVRKRGGENKDETPRVTNVVEDGPTS
jgi:hypothetical protein